MSEEVHEVMRWVAFSLWEQNSRGNCTDHPELAEYVTEGAD